MEEQFPQLQLIVNLLSTFNICVYIPYFAWHLFEVIPRVTFWSGTDYSAGTFLNAIVHYSYVHQEYHICNPAHIIIPHYHYI